MNFLATNLQFTAPMPHLEGMTQEQIDSMDESTFKDLDLAEVTYLYEHHNGVYERLMFGKASASNEAQEQERSEQDMQALGEQVRQAWANAIDAAFERLHNER